MSSSCRLRVRCADERVAKRLEEVLTPDNVAVPKDQRFSMKRRSRTLYFEAESSGTRSPMSSLSSVVDDVALFREIWLISRGSGTDGREGEGC